MIKPKANFIKFTAGIFFVLQIIGATTILSCPLPALAADDSDSVQSLQFTPQVTIPDSGFNSGAATNVGVYDKAAGTLNSTLLANYIGAIYNYGLAIAGILATIMLMAAGVIWLTSGGDSGKISQAKELISGSIVGLIILVVSWVILNTINPDLVALKPIETKVLTAVNVNRLVCCDPTNGESSFPIRVVDGKNMAADGSNVIISCKAPAITCGNNQTCIKNDSEDKYTCAVDNWSCACEIGIQISPVHWYYCQDSMTKEKCNTFCDKKTGLSTSKTYTATVYPSGNYQCYSDGRVYPKPGARCGTEAKATCREKKNALECPDGTSHNISGTDCGPGYFCCY